MATTQTHTQTQKRHGLWCRGRRARSAVVLVAGLLAVLVFAAPASAEFGIKSFDGSANDIDGDPFPVPVSALPDGSRVTQAGAHPDVTTFIRFNTFEAPASGYPGYTSMYPDENVKDLIVDLPPGLIGNPESFPACRPADLFQDQGNGDCPPDTQVGIVKLGIQYGEPGEPLLGRFALFNIEAPEGAPARLGFNIFGAVTTIVPVVVADASVPGGYKISGRVHNASQTLAVVSSGVTLWGVPADRFHDALRMDSLGSTGASSTLEPRPFMTLPTACPGTPLTTRLTAASWQHPDVWKHAEFSSDFNGFPLITDGCSRLGFAPTVAMAPSTSAPDAPAGLDVDLVSPQRLDDPGGLANAQLKDVTATLPEGLTVNPGSADGLQACSDIQLGLGNDEPIGCPDGSKLGTVTATTPVLNERLEGGVFLRSQNSNDPESGEMFRLALVVRNEERGILVKLPGSVVADSDTGRITASFKNNPQFPVEKVELHFKSGPRAPLATPASCGSKTIGTQLTSWAGHDVSQPNAFSVDCTAGLGGFDPSFTAGSVSPGAGEFSTFTVGITKPDGDAAIDGVSIDLPEGLLANLKGNVGAQVGSVKAFAGPGSNPFMLPGRVFLEGAYGAAPFSLRVVVPAKAGPFDLGEVVVRQKLYVNPDNAHVTVVSDPLPTIVKGVPVRLQRLDVAIGKQDFTLNPTSCAQKHIDATLKAADGSSVSKRSPFAVTNCAALAFTPKLAMRLTGKRQTKTGGHPALKTVLTQAKGQANIGKAKVTLPKSIVLDPNNSTDPKLVCDYDKSLKADCPASSVIGKAKAVTPVLNKPLSGNVHLVQGIRFGAKGNRIRTLPTLLIKLRGEVAINLRAKTSTEKNTNRLVTTFPNVPDAPVNKFSLNINGGNNGILVVTRTAQRKLNLCTTKQTANIDTNGHNGKNANFATNIKTPCAKTSKKTRKAKQ